MQPEPRSHFRPFLSLRCGSSGKKKRECELYPDEYYLYDDTGGAAGLAVAFFIGLFIACISAVLWPGIPLVILAEIFLEKIARRFPGLMGNMLDDQEENQGEEND